MKNWISIVLCFIMTISYIRPVVAIEMNDEDSTYNTLQVEYSDNLGNYEDLKVMISDNHIYANASQLGDRLGYQVQINDEYLAIFNKDFSNNVPYGITAFYYNSKKVKHMLFNKMIDYESPIEIIKNSDGIWIPFEFSLLILNSSMLVLDNQIHVEIPEKNLIDIYMDVLKNNERYLFDWKSDAGATDESIFEMGTSSYIVQLFNGLLENDGASWSQLIDNFCMNTDSYDSKYAKDFAKLFCTYSDTELNQIVKNMNEQMKPFNGNNWITKAISTAGELYDEKIGELSKISEDLKKKITDENKSSVLAYNKSYQELDKVCSRADIFYNATDPFVLASKKVKDATSFLDTFYSVAEIIGYASEFNNQDRFAVESLGFFMENSDSKSTMSKAMKSSMKEYKDSLETDIITYSAYNYVISNMDKWITDALNISSAILDAKTKALLLVWNIASDVIPFYKDGISKTNSFLQSIYASIVQADTMSMYIDKRNEIFSDTKNIKPENLYIVAQYCYAYLKSCYITRDAAVGSLTDKTKNSNSRYVTTQNTINQEIAACLIKLKNADKTNEYGCYGFLPENNEQYLKEFDDSVLVELLKKQDDIIEITKYIGNFKKLVEIMNMDYDTELMMGSNNYYIDDFKLSWEDNGYYTISNNKNENISLYGVCIGDSKENALAKIQELAYSYQISSDDSDKIYLLNNDKIVYIEIFYDKKQVTGWYTNNYSEGSDIQKIKEILELEESYNVRNLEKWKSAYIDYILKNDINFNSEYSYNYELININGDDIPEIYIEKNSLAEGSTLCSYSNNSVINLQMYVYGLSYIEGENLFMDSGGHMDAYYNKIYKIEDGEFVIQCKGDYGAEDNSNIQFDNESNPIYTYYWNDSKVANKIEYEKLLSKAFDKERAKEPSITKDNYGYKDIIMQIIKY